MTTLTPQRYGVKQFVARVQGRWSRYNVFATGDAKYYLLDPIDKSGCSLCNAFPILKADLRPALRRALSHGYGNTE